MFFYVFVYKYISLCFITSLPPASTQPFVQPSSAGFLVRQTMGFFRFYAGRPADEALDEPACGDANWTEVWWLIIIFFDLKRHFGTNPANEHGKWPLAYLRIFRLLATLTSYCCPLWIQSHWSDLNWPLQVGTFHRYAVIVEPAWGWNSSAWGSPEMGWTMNGNKCFHQASHNAHVDHTKQSIPFILWGVGIS